MRRSTIPRATVSAIAVALAASPAYAAAAHLQALARISRLLRVPGVADGLRGASSAGGILEVLREAEATLPRSS